MTAYAYALAEIGFCLGVGRGESMVGTQYCFGFGGRPLSQIGDGVDTQTSGL